MNKILLLLFTFECKHLLADFCWQTPYMVNGKCRLHGWLAPLAAHAGLHAVLTLIVMFLFTRSMTAALICAAFDFVAHFIIDRVKSSPNMLGNYKTEDRWFWILLGLDQFAHHATYLLIALVSTDLTQIFR